MTAAELIRAGRLTEARKQAAADVKAAPADAGKRTLLFQVLAFCGEWDKAEAHLDVIASQDVKAELGAQLYRGLLAAEREREAVSWERIPAILPKVPPYLESYLAGRRKLEGKQAEEGGGTVQPGRLIQASPGRKRGWQALHGSPGHRCLPGVLPRGDGPRPLCVDSLRVPSGGVHRGPEGPHGSSVDYGSDGYRGRPRHELPSSRALPGLLHARGRPGEARPDDGLGSPGGAYSQGMGQHVYQIDEGEKALLEIRELTLNIQQVGADDERIG